MSLSDREHAEGFHLTTMTAVTTIASAVMATATTRFAQLIVIKEVIYQ